MKILFGADHAGFEMKEMLIAFVRDELGHVVEDMGAFVYDEGDDYPDFVAKVALRVGRADAQAAAEPGAQDIIRGIILGGSGQGEAITANRERGVRAAVYYGGSLEIVKLSREHNDANVLSLGARFLSTEEAKEAVRIWLSTPFGGEDRHIRRIKKIDSL